MESFLQRYGSRIHGVLHGWDRVRFRGTLRALALMTVAPRLTCPSPAMTTLPNLRTVKIVVPCQIAGSVAGSFMLEAMSA